MKSTSSHKYTHKSIIIALNAYYFNSAGSTKHRAQGRAQGRRSTLNMEPRFHEAGRRTPLCNGQSVLTSDNGAEIERGQ